ncbi:hypothetical protein PVAP13_9NG048373 [Panicum virgatum]|uniref:Uncharacterized protein n=1 Tax=Panicum virgatum TaxID=38727 RepID=A0A8T0MGA4_PANVG|nr:hypothetical protein PVAP13_9NG048373 [Panicum virgatum]
MLLLRLPVSFKTHGRFPFSQALPSFFRFPLLSLFFPLLPLPFPPPAPRHPRRRCRAPLCPQRRASSAPAGSGRKGPSRAAPPPDRSSPPPRAAGSALHRRACRRIRLPRAAGSALRRRRGLLRRRRCRIRLPRCGGEARRSGSGVGEVAGRASGGGEAELPRF